AAITAIAAAYGIGKIGSSAMDAIARQPEASDNIRMNMIIVAALIEGVALFAVVVCFLAI
ncbi:MAG: ATP synthase F0 subunit C, partial [Tannerellaceae bacterium]|nr:ATP synthase F0 subunit C [Tannerellaceae bacterium]